MLLEVLGGDVAFVIWSLTGLSGRRGLLEALAVRLLFALHFFISLLMAFSIGELRFLFLRRFPSPLQAMVLLLVLPVFVFALVAVVVEVVVVAVLK